MATTSASGVASVSLVLTQKLGVYPLTVAWAPAGADAAHYTGSTTGGSFSVNKK